MGSLCGKRGLIAPSTEVGTVQHDLEEAPNLWLLPQKEERLGKRVVSVSDFSEICTKKLYLFHLIQVLGSQHTLNAWRTWSTKKSGVVSHCSPRETEILLTDTERKPKIMSF